MSRVINLFRNFLESPGSTVGLESGIVTAMALFIAVAWVGSLALELPHVSGAAKKLLMEWNA